MLKKITTLFLFTLVFLVTIIRAETDIVQRIPLIEEFSSSTCPPCKTFNDKIFNPFLSNAANKGKFTCVNYRMNWPGKGDPYYTEEAGVRKNHYDVKGVPTCYMDGKKVSANSLSAFNKNFQTAYNKPTNITLSANHAIVNRFNTQAEINTKVVISSSEAIGNSVCHIAVVEKLTTKNTGTNGEKEFHYVMMKMVPDEKGTNITLQPNKEVVINKKAPLEKTHIEEMTDLAIIAWIETSNKEVLQSVISTKGSTKNVLTNTLNLSNTSDIKMFNNSINMTIKLQGVKNTHIDLYNILGKNVLSVNNNNNVRIIKTSSLPTGSYIIRVQGKNILYKQFIFVL